ncbi:hypothetical protein N7495_008192 [Penicillium taxi]|uniref:uncharacterized protein n=1 Tax=Penicillium taxi TaxID=168475 RepID=UPI0025451D6D|nr:uncharacterized protein N7495_008192 [Penicillium taxi]KAJ5888151.1 hypothetical protein N7495_008192 [Penicillium taxi]
MMADEEERAEKLAAAKKRVAQLQKQKKKANKKTSSATDTPKDSESTKDLEPESTESTPATTEEPPVTDGTSNEKPQEDNNTATETTDTKQAIKQESEAEQDKHDESARSPVEPMPPAPTSPGPDVEPQAALLDNPRAGHTRQPSLSIQSKMRSSSFRKTSVSKGSSSPSPSTLKSPQSLPPLTGDGESVHEVFRKQSTRIEELEKDKKHVEKELGDVMVRWRKTEEQLEDLREASVDGAELREKLKKAEEKAASIESLKEEIAALQRQNSQLQSRSHRNNSAPGTSESPVDLIRQLESKSATIEAMELDISNLRAQLTSESSSSEAHAAQIAALEEKASQSQTALERVQRDLTDTKEALTRASEKALKEGVDKTSTDTLIKNLQREIEEVKSEKSEADKKIDTLEKKLQALGNLHKESETRHQTRLKETEKLEKENAVQLKRLASVENENLRLREEQDRTRKRDASGAADDELEELEDEERQRLERRIRELEGEVFDLRRGVWQEKRQELADHQHNIEGSEAGGDAGANAFDDVDLIGGRPDHSRRRSMAMQQHSSLSTVLSSGIAAFTGSANRPRAGSNQPQATRGSLELLAEENFDDEFDEAEFARAQAEEEARKRVEWVREIKRKLRDWNSWRLDLVDSRAGAEGFGVGMGQIFEV